MAWTGTSRVKGRARAKPVPGSMNKTEQSYEAHLKRRQLAGEILEFKFEAVKLRLADKTFYTPYFLVVLPDGLMELHEVKGFWEDDARVKIKVAATTFWMFSFFGVQKSGAGWKVEEF